MTRFHVPSLAALALYLFSTAGHAATFTGTACDVASVEGATACAGIFSGNDSNTAVDGLFGVTGWTQVAKLDASSGTISGGGNTFTVTNTGNGGTWTISSYAGFAPVMFVTKGGPTYSAFLMDLATLTGAWNTDSMLKGNGQRGADLSHWSIYQGGLAPVTPETGPETNPVPLPAAVWMLLAGVGALAGTRRA